MGDTGEKKNMEDMADVADMTGGKATAQEEPDVKETVQEEPAKNETAQKAPVTKGEQKEETSPKETPRKEAVPEVYLQYREYEVTMEAVTERVKAHYFAKGHPKDSIEDMEIYIKPEDFTAYYVINGGIMGKVNLF